MRHTRTLASSCCCWACWAFRLPSPPSLPAGSRRALLSLPPCRSIISRTDIFQRALSAKKEFYEQLATYDEDYLGSQGAQTVGRAAPSAWASETRCKRSWPAQSLLCVQLFERRAMQPDGPVTCPAMPANPPSRSCKPRWPALMTRRTPASVPSPRRTGA